MLYETDQRSREIRFFMAHDAAESGGIAKASWLPVEPTVPRCAAELTELSSTEHFHPER